MPFNLRAVLLDIQGPKIRTGSFVDGAIDMKQGKEYILTTDEVGGRGLVRVDPSISVHYYDIHILI